MEPKRYVLVGTGSRGLGMFARPLINDFADTAELVGLFDTNSARMKAVNKILGTDLPCFGDFDAMMGQLDPDGLCIATVDSTHAQYVIAGMEAGKRVYCEKPLCTTAAQCRDIAAAATAATEENCGGAGFVTHNMRYGPAVTKIKELLDAGKIGRLLSIEFRENLDRRHGASYFRRWHRFKENSGGLLVHKASHHFDALNWFVAAKPDVLTAMGDSVFYGANGPLRSARCRDCPHSAQCAFHADITGDEKARLLYIDAEAEDGYMRDGCLFDERIDTEDQASVLYSYENGVQVTYHLKAYASYEGILMTFEGTDGRLEYEVTEDTSWVIGDHTEYGLGEQHIRKLTFFDQQTGAEAIDIPTIEGSHGGSDPQLRHDFFALPWQQKRPNRMASLDEAIQAVLVGAAANESIAAGGAPVKVQNLLRGPT